MKGDLVKRDRERASTQMGVAPLSGLSGLPDCPGTASLQADIHSETLRKLVTQTSRVTRKHLILWRARQESNLYRELRKLLFYPLNYGRRVLNYTHNEQSCSSLPVDLALSV